MAKRAVLLSNLGSPDSPSVADVRRYLRKFLGDERVLDMPGPLRRLVLETAILPTRPRRTSRAYASIWKTGPGPLIETSLSVRQKLAEVLDGGPPVYLAMRYGRPSMPETVAKMAAAGIEEVLHVPQYPHYAMSSWETAAVRVYEEASRQSPKMRVTCVQPFYADADFIEALHAVSAPWLAKPHDLLLFSYHGLPVRHMRKADSSGAHCMKVDDCCLVPSPSHATCYRAQCFATTRAFAARARLEPGRHAVSFQSRLAGEPWLQPFTDHEFIRLPKTGVKRLLVICPAFVADCLETLEEIAIAGRETFLKAGGENYEKIPCLNDQEPYIAFLAGRVRRWLSS